MPVTITLKHAWLFKGPDAGETKKIIRKLILSADDIGAKVAACKTMRCTDPDLNSGMTVDLDAGPRLNYWVVLDNQRVQHSGTAAPARTLHYEASDASQLSSTMSCQRCASGGCTVRHH